MNALKPTPLFGEQSEDQTPASAWSRDADKRFLDELFDNVASYRKSTAYRELIQFVSRFHFYAPYNAMLVHVQKPGAKYVLPAHKWRKAHGRTICPGAQPIVILQPFGPVMFVFDVSETEGPPLPDAIENPFGVRNGRIGSQLSRTLRNAIRDGIRITEVRHGSQRAGSIGHASTNGIDLELDENVTVPVRYEMLLNANHEKTVKYATVTHEVGHLYCGHLGTPNDRWWPDRRGLSLETREFEAESVAYLVCKRAGIQPASDEYLSGYMEVDSEIPKISVDRVLTVTGLIEQMGREKMKTRRQR